MPGILAIEPDGQRRALLTRFLREHAQVDVTTVDSVTAAIDRFDELRPDLILAPALLSPAESDRLRGHVKRHADPHVQMLMLPALDLLREASVEPQRSWFRRRRTDSSLPYDPVMTGRQVAEGLQLACQLRERPASALDLRAVMNMEERKGLPVGPERRRAERTPQRSPWLWSVRLPWGGDADLVNISRTGILIESASRVSPGMALDLRLTARGVSRIVMARFVRSEVAQGDHGGSRYRSAAQFEQPLDIVPCPDIAPRATAQSLGDLFASVLAESNESEPRAARFARGLPTLVGAREVLLRRLPITVPDEGDSIYFSVKEDSSSRTILQVIFERPPTAAEFCLLKAAAALTRAVLDLEGCFGEPARPADVA